jgi:hypothetical protein
MGLNQIPGGNVRGLIFSDLPRISQQYRRCRAGLGAGGVFRHASVVRENAFGPCWLSRRCQ